MIDIGAGSQFQLGVPKSKMDVSIAELETQGYVRVKNSNSPSLAQQIKPLFVH